MRVCRYKWEYLGTNESVRYKWDDVGSHESVHSVNESIKVHIRMCTVWMSRAFLCVASKLFPFERKLLSTFSSNFVNKIFYESPKVLFRAKIDKTVSKIS